MSLLHIAQLEEKIQRRDARILELETALAVAPQPPAGQQDRGEADCLAGIYKPAAKAAVNTLIAMGYKFGHKPGFDGLAWNAPATAGEATAAQGDKS